MGSFSPAIFNSCHSRGGWELLLMEKAESTQIPSHRPTCTFPWQQSHLLRKKISFCATNKSWTAANGMRSSWDLSLLLMEEQRTSAGLQVRVRVPLPPLQNINLIKFPMSRPRGIATTTGGFWEVATHPKNTNFVNC